MENDIVVDATVIRLYGAARDPVFKDFFRWLFGEGILACSQMLLVEYGRIGSNAVASLIDHLVRERRLQKYTRERIRRIDDRHFAYTCNYADRWHVRLVCTES